MSSLAGALSKFTDHLGSFQTRIQNLANVIPTVIDSAQELSTELKQLSPDRLENLHKPQPITNNQQTENNDEDLDEVKLDLARTQDYHSRGKIHYASKALEIGVGYQFNRRVFQDNLETYKAFFSEIDNYFTQAPSSLWLTKNDFTKWFKSFQNIHKSDTEIIPIGNIEVPKWKLLQTVEDDAQKLQIAQSSKAWLDLANESLKLLKSAHGINSVPYIGEGADTMNPSGIYQIGELKKFLLAEMQENFNKDNLEKLLKICSDNKKILGLDYHQMENLKKSVGELKSFKPKQYLETMSDFDLTESLTLNPKNIDYIRSVFTKQIEAKPSDTEYSCLMLDKIHSGYIENYPQESSIDDKDRNKTASQILNMIELVQSQNHSEEEKNFINSLKNFYKIEKDNTASL
jgi:hypothetical protein